MKKSKTLFKNEIRNLLWQNVQAEELVGLTSEERRIKFEENNRAFEQLLEKFPKTILRITVWIFDAADNDDESGSFVENLDETLNKLVLPADDVCLYLNEDNEVILKTEYHECVAYSQLRGVEHNHNIYDDNIYDDVIKSSTSIGQKFY